MYSIYLKLESKSSNKLYETGPLPSMGRSAAATGAQGEKVWECLRPLLPCCATGVRAGRTNGDGAAASDRLIAFCPQRGKGWGTATKKWSNAFGAQPGNCQKHIIVVYNKKASEVLCLARLRFRKSPSPLFSSVCARYFDT